jgi:hypothetical protein
MPSPTDLANFALGLVAEQRITSLTDDSEPARLCNLHLANTVREVLRGGLWRCARKRAVLTQNAVAPAFGWHYSYPLPPDFLRAVSLNETEPQDIEDTLWEIEGKELLTDENTASLIYISDVTTQTGGAGYNQLDAMCARAVYTSLAAKLAVALQGQAVNLHQSLLQQAELFIAKANVVNMRDACEPLMNRTTGSGWIRQGRSIGGSM